MCRPERKSERGVVSKGEKSCPVLEKMAEVVGDAGEEGATGASVSELASQVSRCEALYGAQRREKPLAILIIAHLTPRPLSSYVLL